MLERDLACWCWWDTGKPSCGVKGIKKSILRGGGEATSGSPQSQVGTVRTEKKKKQVVRTEKKQARGVTGEGKKVSECVIRTFKFEYNM